MQQHDKPVFFDGTGRRWKITRLVLATLLVVIISLTAVLLPRVLAYGQVNGAPGTLSAANQSNAVFPRAEPSIADLVNKINQGNVDVFGKGPLVRIVRLQADKGKLYSVDPFSGEINNEISSADKNRLQHEEYAIEQYGQTSGSGKRIALTFDDGPDPVYTPQLLDLLSKESAQASFFMVGSNVTKYPELAARVAREGHTIGNHTYSHIDFDFVGASHAQQEINQDQRVIRATTGSDSPYFRAPYGGNTEQSYRSSLTALLTAQKLGYTNTEYSFDSDDWQYATGTKPKYPNLDGQDKVILVHDAGGDRSRTIPYVAEVIKRAKAQGYTFVTLDEMYGRQVKPVAASVADKTSLAASQAVFVWPHDLIIGLFVVSLIMLFLTTLLNLVLAKLNLVRTKFKPRARGFAPHVTVIVPCYNEGTVLAPTVRSLLASSYKYLDIILIDDGSTDDTWSLAKRLAKRHKRVKAIHQNNTGKSGALNNAMRRTKSDIVICVDADTIFPPSAIGKMVRHFNDPKVGAVAGVVKVGNVGGLITRWQALEYVIGIGIERNAQAFMNSIMIVPGACGAWRREAIVAAGGFSHHTLAEDCDLALTLQEAGYKILQDNEAISYTEAPDKLRALVKQRFRWTFGNIQALYKHRTMLFRRRFGLLGMFVMPSAVIAILIPIVFWPVLITITIQNLLAGNYKAIAIFFVISMVLQFILSSIGLRLSKERFSYLWAVPFARFVYSPIRTYILYKTVLTVLRGAYVGWNKLARTGTVSYGKPTRKPNAPSRTAQPSNG